MATLTVQRKYVDKLQMLPVKLGGSSRTTPDQSMTVKDIMKKYGNNETVLGNKFEPVYNGDLVIPDVNKMDFTDLEEYRRVLANKAREVKQQEKEMQEALNNLDVKTFDERLLEAMEQIAHRSAELDNPPVVQQTKPSPRPQKVAG